ncbi:quinone-dependent dihydroorotate dehydrogenase [Sediminicurvatus halobius]|uniref:Dihydroorotate dehydrogenase (quinone) n=1 Tax=Sediminicurvatus halobius TaxID=2182432 RepID=A0A2U2N4P4_9GAMM|nr:quinone-dependent dihydroorotate dehydrogenase [Spiribacter halobius]PWG63949.1 quinone-dependent dihydroorotate dehydrogenase [Spiribacter halobius]UEX76364.1 quinone-dependent dihydroorotate dehydrogenase [Spiribacter halobius]
MYPLARSLLFRLDPERAHAVVMGTLDVAAALHLAGLAGRRVHDPVEVMGLRFPNAVGLAAGLDKNGDHLRGLAALGFGFVELGTVTPRPQPGNPRPRMFRLPAEQALINRMGFNNRGVDHLLRRLAAWRPPVPVGINIGKNRDTPLESAVEDYRYCLERVYAAADYVVVNLSSPNTPGLRDLQAGRQLEALLASLKADQAHLAAEHGRYVPLVVKIAPDLDDAPLRALVQALRDHGVDGIAATNTTISREAVPASPVASEAGGLSGAPLRERATAVLRRVRQEAGPRLPLIGVGGILSGEDAAARIAAGADLVQLYTGLIYRGPALVGEAARAVAEERSHRHAGTREPARGALP